ncbi:MAG: transcription termination/antitermination protein NusG [Planctomycetia bacterium]|nr:transcription termination/antitermination protein NusG [Planctomycetia bacterium]
MNQNTDNTNAEELTQPGNNKQWYILKVQVNREDSIKEGILRRIQLSGLDSYFGEIVVPTEKVTTVKNGKKRISKRKLYPGYLMIFMEITEETWFLIRETSGVGDFTGAGGKPIPMLPHEVQKMLQSEQKETNETPKLKIPYQVGDRVKIIDGTFKDIEGEVGSIDEIDGRVTVIITIFARNTPVDLEYWQIERVEE